jgi:cation diffusion facilitator family transporter
MGANVAIAAAKFGAWLLTGAASLLAEAIHSAADSANQILMLIGGKASRRPATAQHPFGFGRDRYISAFLVAIILFSMGGLFALYEAWHKFQEVAEGHPNELLESAWWWVPIAVLGFGIVAESFSLRTALREIKAVKGSDSLVQFVRSSRAPELPVILLEDIAALTGLVFAMAGVSLTLLTHNGYWDVIASGLIGVLLVAVAIIVAIEIKSLLVGESARPEAEQRISQALTSDPALERLIYLKTIHIGPETILVAAKVAVAPDLDSATVAAAIDAAEARVRAAEPQVGPMFLEPDVWRDEDKAELVSEK